MVQVDRELRGDGFTYVLESGKEGRFIAKWMWIGSSPAGSAMLAGELKCSGFAPNHFPFSVWLVMAERSTDAVPANRQ